MNVTDAIGYYAIRIEQLKQELVRLANTERDGNYVGEEVMLCHMEIAHARNRIKEIYAGLGDVEMPDRHWNAFPGTEA